MTEPSREAVEQIAATLHEQYLATARWLGWPLRREVDVPYGSLSEDAKELDRVFARWHLTVLDAAQAAVWEAAAKEIPNNWLDPLLTGPDAVVPKECAAVDQYVIEKLLQALGKRLRARATAARSAGDEGR